MLFEHIHILLPDGSILENGYVLIQNTDITYIGKEKPLHCDAIPCYDGHNKLLLPGFINTHCHIPMTLLRGLGADLPLMDWLFNAIFPVEQKLTADDIYWGSLAGMAELIRSGVTSFSDMYYQSQAIAQAALETGIKANLALDENAALREKGDFFLAKDFYKEYHKANNGQILVDMSIHAEYTTSPEGIRSIVAFGEQSGSVVQLHLSETEKETKECIERHGMTPAAYFDSLGVFNLPAIAAHCVFMTDEDLEILRKRHVSVAHCPISNLKLGSGIADVAKMLKKGINVTIGTDGTASNDNLNMLEDIKYVPLLQKGLHKNPTLLPAPSVLHMATKNGAAAQNRPDTGEIAIGKKADLVVMDFSSIHTKPALDLTAGVVYSSNLNDVLLTMVNGKVLYENGSFKTLDTEKIAYETDRIASRLYTR